MSDSVFANGMSVACKVSGGKSIAATPDVCLSPPSPPAGPIPIPYPNTAAASDTHNGSKSVLIQGEEVMLKNKSVFKTSTGNEAATKSLGMGVVTHQVQGEASFISWSMDVKFEGENIPRHLDLMGHNEACNPPNPPPAPFKAKKGPKVSRQSCNPHTWILKQADPRYDAAEKKKRLRASGISGRIAEADAADHNKVTDKEKLSGLKKQDQLRQVCVVCNADGGDVDHITKDKSGNNSLVEVKSGGCDVDKPQLMRRLALAKTMGASVTVKLTGHGASIAEGVIKADPVISMIEVIHF